MATHSHPPLPCPNKKGYIRGGIRTRDLLLRRQTRYPLRYTDMVVFESPYDPTLPALPRSLVG